MIRRQFEYNEDLSLHVLMTTSTMMNDYGLIDQIIYQWLFCENGLKSGNNHESLSKK